MDPFTAATGIAGIISLAGSVLARCYQYGCAVKGGPKEIQLLLNEMMNLTGVLAALKASLHPEPELGDNPPAYTRVKTDSLSGLRAPLDGCEQALKDVLNALERARAGSEQKVKNALKRLLWPLKKDDTMALVRRLEGYKATFNFALNAEAVVTGTETLDAVHGIQKELDQSRSEQESQKAMVRTRQIHQWLCTVNYELPHIAACRLRHPGTGKWFIKSAIFNSWLDGKTPFLWLYGITGSGKTILTSSVLIECLLPKRSSQVPVAYFYCDFRDPDSQRKEAVIGALLLQVCKQLKSFPAVVEEALDDHRLEDGNVRPATYHELEELLLKVLHDCQSTVIVIDALDECKDRNELLQFLTRISDLQILNVKILVTSRQEWDIKQAFLSLPQIPMYINEVDYDVRQYLTTVISVNERLQRLSPSLQETIVNSLTRRSNGMFRWARCQIEELSKLDTARAVREALNILPKDLDEIYERLFEKIEERDKIVARRCFLCLAYAVRPLRLTELAEVVVLDIGVKALDPESRYYDPEDLLKVIGSFVIHSPTTDEVVLAHNSVKDFLRSDRTLLRNPYYHLVDQAAHMEMVQLCFTYLTMKDFVAGPSKGLVEFRKRVLDYPFYPYAARQWPSHFRSIHGFKDQESLVDMAMGLMNPAITPHFRAWVQAIILDHIKGNKGVAAMPPRVTPLYYAASYGLVEILTRLIDAGADPDEPGGRFSGTPLHAAVYRGHFRIVQLLVNAGANPWIKDVDGTDAIEWASMGRQRKMLDILKTSKFRATGS